MKKPIFVHIPKTAGLSLYNLICKEVKLLDHDTRNPDFKFLKEYSFSDNPFIFCFVRNPWDRLVSSYFYLKNGGDPIYSADADDFDFYFGSFTLFKDMLLNWSNSFYNQIHFKPQYEWVCDDDDNILVDFIGRFENLQQDFNIVCDKIGTPQQKLPHTHKSKHKHYTEYYDDETRQIVAEKYAKDIEYFGYEFGD